MPNLVTSAIFYDGIAPEQPQRAICTLMCRSLGMEVAKAIKYARIINRSFWRRRCVWAHSSMVEQGTHNPLVLGSNPGGPTIRKHLPSLRVAAFLFVRHSFIQSILCACAVLRKSNAIYMQLRFCWLYTAHLLVYHPLLLSLTTVLTIHLGTETAGNCAKNKPPAIMQVAYIADGWNAGLFNFFTETLSLFK